ncbi:uncharacterized protein DS421_15g489170 [Arachis hypogaea]|nr:uncharacterized protein DS421_15g489170 [Arachis hypogaea]
MEEPFTIVASAVVVNGARRQGSITDVTANEPSQFLFGLAQPHTPFIFVSKSAPFSPVLIPFVKL